MAVVKRERSTKWEKEEKQLLREIIKPLIEIIEKKDLSTNTNKAKLRAWAEITEKFNTMNTRIRDKKQIMNQWKVTKINSKKELSKFRQESRKTGGGPRPPSPTPETQELVNLIPQEFEIDFNEFDCDRVSKDVYVAGKRGYQGGMSISSLVRLLYRHRYYRNKKSLKKHLLIMKNWRYVLRIPWSSTKFEILESKENIDKRAIIDTQCEASAPPITPKRTARKTPTSKKSNFDFGEASFTDMHNFRVLENERLQKEHELRMQHTKELHEQALINLKLQQQILCNQLANLNK